MAITPSLIFALALERHRMEWNWTLHFAALPGMALTLLLHSYLLLAATLIVFGAGFFELNMPAPPDNGWFRFVRSGVEWEKDWVAYPWTWSKWWRFLAAMSIALFSVWALWTRDMPGLVLLAGGSCLAKVVRDNKKDEIEP